MKKTGKRKTAKLGKTQKKILLLLLGGIALGLSGSPRKYFQILEEVQREWKEIDNSSGKRSILSLHTRGFLEEKKLRDGSVRLLLSEHGHQAALEYSLEEVTIPKRRTIVWDRKWRIVTFDIPEKKKAVRDSIRYHLKRIGFVELRQSVFIYPFGCWEEVQMIIDFYHADLFVHLIVADAVSNDGVFRKHFKLAQSKS